MISSSVISEENFYRKLKNNDFNGHPIATEFKVLIDSNNLNWNFRKISNVTFHELVEIKDVNIKEGLFFSKCKFLKGISFKNIDTEVLTLSNQTENITFSGCEADYVFLNDVNLTKGFKVVENSGIKNLQINFTEISSGELKVYNSEISKNLNIDNVKADVIINESNIEGVFHVVSLTGDISMLNTEIKGWCKFWNITTKDAITSNNSTFHGEFKISASKLYGFYSHNDIFKKKSELENRDTSKNKIQTFCNKIYITDSNFVEGFDFNGLGKPIQNIDLRITPNLKGILKFDGWQAEKILISGVNQNLKLLLKNMVFETLMLNNFTNYNDFTFDRCKAKADGVFNLYDCDLGKTRFNEFDFNSFGEIRTENVSLDEIKASNVIWFPDDKLITNQEEEINIPKTFKRKREIYRQIKQALKSAGNQIDSLEFQAKEMQAYRDQLNNSKDYKWTDRLIMITNQLNNYGLSWWKPLWILFLVTLGFYFVMLPIFSSKINYTVAKSCKDICITFCELWNNGPVFWQMFNPVRRVNLVFGENQNGWLYFLDYFHRIILGVFIFKIIKAFRRLASK